MPLPPHIDPRDLNAVMAERRPRLQSLIRDISIIRAGIESETPTRKEATHGTPHHESL
jgi:hypothetical protein